MKKTAAMQKIYPKQQLYGDIMLASQLGFTIALPLVGGTIVGWLLDARFGTKPLWTLELLGAGLVITIYYIIHVAKRFTRQ